LHMAIRQQRRSEHIKMQDLQPHHKESSLSVHTVHYLIDAGEMALLIPDKHGNTPLHLAIALESNAKIMQHLIEACTPPDAIYTDSVAMCEMPCESAISMQNRDLRTPLHLALKHDNRNARPAYIMHPAYIMRRCPQAMLLRDKNGRTPMHLMLWKVFTEIDLNNVLELLLMQPGVLLIQDNLGCTPLHTLLKNIERYKYRNIQRDSQEKFSWYLTGITPGLLTRDQRKQLMGLTDAENRTPLQYYLEKFSHRNHPYFFDVLGRELGRVHANV